MSKLICNRAHICVKAEGCKHAVPHDPTCDHAGCGPAMPCNSDPSGEISACVPVTPGGTYQTYHRDWCPHCKGRGYHDRTETHVARTDVAT